MLAENLQTLECHLSSYASWLHAKGQLSPVGRCLPFQQCHHNVKKYILIWSLLSYYCWSFLLSLLSTPPSLVSHDLSWWYPLRISRIAIIHLQPVLWYQLYIESQLDNWSRQCASLLVVSERMRMDSEASWSVLIVKFWRYKYERTRKAAQAKARHFRCVES